MGSAHIYVHFKGHPSPSLPRPAHPRPGHRRGRKGPGSGAGPAASTHPAAAAAPPPPSPQAAAALALLAALAPCVAATGGYHGLRRIRHLSSVEAEPLPAPRRLFDDWEPLDVPVPARLAAASRALAGFYEVSPLAYRQPACLPSPARQQGMRQLRGRPKPLSEGSVAGGGNSNSSGACVATRAALQLQTPPFKPLSLLTIPPAPLALSSLPRRATTTTAT